MLRPVFLGGLGEGKLYNIIYIKYYFKSLIKSKAIFSLLETFLLQDEDTEQEDVESDRIQSRQCNLDVFFVLEEVCPYILGTYLVKDCCTMKTPVRIFIKQCVTKN